jgi:tRNA pseudouridine38-40 synthase
MPRYFLEVSYKGTQYSGFQIQENAPTIQSEIESAFAIYFKQKFSLTGSSRTDAGVHANQNYFHFDADISITPKDLYHVNAILPSSIVAKNIRAVKDTAHCRFDAVSREYEYFIYTSKDPFKEDRAWFYPFTLNMSMLQEAASVVMKYHDFTSFSKRNTQVNNFNCSIEYSSWRNENGYLIYTVRSNRFLRGMVRGLVGTMLKVGREIITINQFKEIIEAKNCSKADFTTPAHGLFLHAVHFPDQIFI